MAISVPTKTTISKGAIFASLLVFGMGGLIVPTVVSAEENACSVSWRLATCQPATFRSHGIPHAILEEQQRIAFLKAEALRRATAWPTEFVKITKNMKKPNSVKIPFEQAPPISAETREENGRRVCAHKKDKGNKSKQDKDVHIDRECCLDPDEVPNPRCYYPKLGENNSPDRVRGADGKKYIK